MILPSRGRKGRDRYYRAKLTIFAAGTLLLLAGIRLGKDWLVNVAIGVLAAAVVLRFLPQKQADDVGDSDTQP